MRKHFWRVVPWDYVPSGLLLLLIVTVLLVANAGIPGPVQPASPNGQIAAWKLYVYVDVGQNGATIWFVSNKAGAIVPYWIAVPVPTVVVAATVVLPATASNVPTTSGGGGQ